MFNSHTPRCLVVLIVLVVATAIMAPARSAAGDANEPGNRAGSRWGPLHKAEPLAPRPNLWQLLEPLPAPEMEFDAEAPVVDVAAEAALTPPTGDDLAPTIDAQITQEIIDQAAALGSAEAIYEFVRNECVFQAYYGSRKGAVETLRQRAGNDYDLASLLIALLRAFGIPARYAEGDVELSVDQATGWLAVDAAEVPGSILYTSGMEGVSVVASGGGTTCCYSHGTPGCDDPDIEACVCALDSYCCDTQWDAQCVDEVASFGCGECVNVVVAVRAHRVWVEAWVSRGFAGPAWVPLDPASKLNRVSGGPDIPEEMGLDAQAFIEEYFDPADPGTILPRAETPLELLEQLIGDYLDVQHPGLTPGDAMRHQAPVPEVLELLPASLPYTVRSRDGEFSEIPADRRYQIRFHLYDGATDLIDQTLDLPAIAGSRVSIDYVGATPSDEAIIDANGGIYQTPPALVELKPVLRVDGQDVATGAAGVGMGLLHSSDIHFLAPVNAYGLPQNVVPVIYNVITTGAAQVVGFAVNGVAEGLLDPPPQDDTEGLAALRHDTAMDYLSRTCAAERRLGGLMHAHVTTGVADAIVENVVRVTYDIYGVPQTFEWRGLRVDADRSVLGFWPADRLDPPEAEPSQFMIVAGAEGSLQESLVYEDSYGQDSVSTIKILELASHAGIPVYERWSTLPLPANTQPASVRQALESAILGGRVVTFPADPMTLGEPETGQWTGTGWISMNPANGAAGYLISGGHNGGATVESWPPEFIDLSEEDRSIRDVEIEIVTPSADSPDGEAVFTRDNEENLVFEYRIHVTYDDGSTNTLPGGEGTYQRVTQNTTRTLAPGNYTFTIWVGRTVFWIFLETLASAERDVSIVGVLVRGPSAWWNPFTCGSDPEKLLPIFAEPPGTVPVDLQACVYPGKAPDNSDLPTGYAWGGGALLSYTAPGSRETRVEPAGDVPSAALDDQNVEVVVSLPGGKEAHGYLSFDYTAGGNDELHTMTVYKVSMEYPEPPPLDEAAGAPDYFGNEFTFSDADPGEITVRCRALVEPAIDEIKDDVDDRLKWEIPDMSTFLGFGGWSWTESWGLFNSGGKGHGIDVALFAEESDLPSSNDRLGRQTVTISLEVDGDLHTAETREAEFFFPRDALNHPGDPDDAPNWFYYWKDGGVCGITDEVEYDPNTNAFGYYVPGEDHINIGAIAATANTGPENYCAAAGSGFGCVQVTGVGIGPDCVAETIAHELRHKFYHESWSGDIAAAEADGENNGDDYDDPDNDGIPNVHEPGYDGIGSDPNDPDTYNMGGGYAGYGDQEVRCRNYELLHNILVDVTKDWANPGTNSNPPYVP